MIDFLTKEGISSYKKKLEPTGTEKHNNNYYNLGVLQKSCFCIHYHFINTM